MPKVQYSYFSIFYHCANYFDNIVRKAKRPVKITGLSIVICFQQTDYSAVVSSAVFSTSLLSSVAGAAGASLAS